MSLLEDICKSLSDLAGPQLSPQAVETLHGIRVVHDDPWTADREAIKEVTGDEP